jgi:hypothetical protein
MFSKLYTNEPYYLEVCVTDGNGDPVGGLTIEYSIAKLPNIPVEQGTLGFCESGNYRGYQKLVRFGKEGQYRIYYHLPEGYPDAIEHVIVERPVFENFLKRFLKYYPL